MSNSFLLRSRGAWLREICGAWVSLTVGSLIFGIVAARLTPEIGWDAALAASLILAAPVAALLLQSIRTGRIRRPHVPKRPAERATVEESNALHSDEMMAFWDSLDPDARAGLRYLAGLIGAYLLTSRIARVHFQIDERTAFAVDQEMLMNGPAEFTIHIAGDTKRMVIVKVDKEKRSVDYTVVPEGREPRGPGGARAARGVGSDQAVDPGEEGRRSG